MEFSLQTTVGSFLVLLGVMLGGTFMSPMQSSTVMMVSGGLAVFGVLSLLLGVKYGEYRATH